MIDITNLKSIYLYSQPVDMRLGMYKIETILSMTFSPIEIIGSIFIFVSKDYKTIKIYYEDEYGKWLLINKLSYTKFKIPDLTGTHQISKTDLLYLLKGVALESQRLKEITI